MQLIQPTHLSSNLQHSLRLLDRLLALLLRKPHEPTDQEPGEAVPGTRGVPHRALELGGWGIDEREGGWGLASRAEEGERAGGTEGED